MLKKYTFILIIILSFISVISYSQNNIIDSIFQNKSELTFKFKAKSKLQVDTLITNIVSVDAYNSTSLTGIAVASKTQFINFLKLNIPYWVIVKDQSKAINMASTVSQMALWNKYPYYQVYDTMMTQYQTKYPNLCKRYDLVTLSSERKLIILKLTNNVNTKASKPQFLYSSTMHGDEVTGYVMMLHLIDYLLSNYGTNTRVTNILNNIEVWILPDSNPDGTYHGGNTTLTGAQRYNGNNIDLNRNYPDPSSGSHPDGNAYQPETQTLMNFADTMNFVMSANFHGGSDVVNFPWDDWTSSTKKTADDLWWRYVAANFADSAQVSSASIITDYFKGTYPSGITEGGDWYIITGGRQDYMNYFKHCREVTIEISVNKELSSDSLPIYWNALRGSFLKYIEECQNGIRGIISDSCSGLPIKAKVYVNSHDADSSWVWSGSRFGNYYRPIKAGTWSVTFSATGYTSKTFSITTHDGSAVIKNVNLMPLSPANPVSSYTYSTNLNTVNFTNTSTNGISYSWNFGDGNTSTTQNPVHSYLSTGTYTVKLIVSNGCAETNTSSQQVTINAVGINNLLEDNNIELYPNPTTSSFTLNINTDKCEAVKISIVDIIGNLIYEDNKTLVAGDNNFKIDMSNNRQGVYIIQIATSTNKIYRKLIKND
jgi:PKD repeat protein